MEPVPICLDYSMIWYNFLLGVNDCYDVCKVIFAVVEPVPICLDYSMIWYHFLIVYSDGTRPNLSGLFYDLVPFSPCV